MLTGFSGKERTQTFASLAAVTAAAPAQHSIWDIHQQQETKNNDEKKFTVNGIPIKQKDLAGKSAGKEEKEPSQQQAQVSFKTKPDIRRWFQKEGLPFTPRIDNWLFEIGAFCLEDMKMIYDEEYWYYLHCSEDPPYKLITMRKFFLAFNEYKNQGSSANVPVTATSIGTLNAASAITPFPSTAAAAGAKKKSPQVTESTTATAPAAPKKLCGKSSPPRPAVGTPKTAAPAAATVAAAAAADGAKEESPQVSKSTTNFADFSSAEATVKIGVTTSPKKRKIAGQIPDTVEIVDLLESDDDDEGEPKKKEAKLDIPSFKTVIKEEALEEEEVHDDDENENAHNNDSSSSSSSSSYDDDDDDEEDDDKNDEDFSLQLSNTARKISKAHLQKQEEKWLEKYELLKAYHEENGHFTISKHKKLGQWLSKQRALYCRPGALSSKRIKLLNEIGFVWKPSVSGGAYDFQWLAQYDKLKKYHEKYGHCGVTAKHDKKLTTWVYNQRNIFHHGKMRQDRKERLDKLDFEWDPCNYYS